MTLKDIQKCVTCSSIGEKCVDYEKLKEEAIKHINSRGGKAQIDDDDVIQWIMNFFNITEEEC